SGCCAGPSASLPGSDTLGQNYRKSARVPPRWKYRCRETEWFVRGHASCVGSRPPALRPFLVGQSQNDAAWPSARSKFGLFRHTARRLHWALFDHRKVLASVDTAPGRLCPAAAIHGKSQYQSEFVIFRNTVSRVGSTSKRAGPAPDPAKEPWS